MIIVSHVSENVPDTDLYSVIHIFYRIVVSVWCLISLNHIPVRYVFSNCFYFHTAIYVEMGRALERKDINILDFKRFLRSILA